MKDILVYCDGTGGDNQRLAAAAQLGQEFRAYVECVLALEIPSPVIVAGGMGAAVTTVDDSVRNEAIADANLIAAGFADRLAKDFPQFASKTLIDVGEVVARSIAELSRTFDLFIISSASERSADFANSSFDSVLQYGGSGILVLPRSEAFEVGCKRVLIAWNGSREASRAVSLSMSLVQRADEVVVLLVDPPLRLAGKSERPGDELVRHLEHHGVSSQLVRANSGEMDTAHAIMAEAERFRSNLLVMGAQAEGGLLQWFRGSTSRKILEKGGIPLFVAH